MQKLKSNFIIINTLSIIIIAIQCKEIINTLSVIIITMQGRGSISRNGLKHIYINFLI